MGADLTSNRVGSRAGASTARAGLGRPSAAISERAGPPAADACAKVPRLTGRSGRGGLAPLDIAWGRLRHHDRSGRRQALDWRAVMRAGEVGHPRLKREIAGVAAGRGHHLPRAQVDEGCNAQVRARLGRLRHGDLEFGQKAGRDEAETEAHVRSRFHRGGDGFRYRRNRRRLANNDCFAAILGDDLHGQLIVAGGLVDDGLDRSRLDTRSHALLDVVHVEIHGGGSVQVSTRRAGWFSAKAVGAETATRSPRRSITRSTVCGAGDPFSDGVEGQNRLSEAFTRSQARLARTQESRRAARKSRPKNGWPATALNNTGASKQPARA